MWDCEQTVVAAMIKKPSCITDVASILSAEDFSSTMLSNVFSEAIKKYLNGDTIDVVDFIQDLEPSYKGDIAEMCHVVPDVDNVINQAKRTKQESKRRKVIEYLEAEKEKINKIDSGQIDSEIGKASVDISSSIEEESIAAQHISSGWQQYFEEWEMAEEGITKNILTGVSFLDEAFDGGLVKGQLYFIAGRPATGKTTLALNCLSNFATRGNSLLMSLEMDRSDIFERNLSHKQQIPYKKIREFDLDDFNLDVKAFSNDGLWVDDHFYEDIEEMIKMMTIYVKHHNLNLVAIDYLQLISGGTNRKAHEDIGHVLFQLKKWAKRYNIPLIILTQMNREYEKSERQPLMSDLYGSSFIEQLATGVAFLWYESEEDKQQKRPTFLVDKNRFGQTTSVKCNFNANYMTFESVYC
jgi:replicative DNA helicase